MIKWALLIAVGIGYWLWLAGYMIAPGIKAYQQHQQQQYQNVQQVANILNGR